MDTDSFDCQFASAGHNCDLTGNLTFITDNKDFRGNLDTLQTYPVAFFLFMCFHYNKLSFKLSLRSLLSFSIDLLLLSKSKQKRNVANFQSVLMLMMKLWKKTTKISSFFRLFQLGFVFVFESCFVKRIFGFSFFNFKASKSDY